jgi:hypothetical protein
VIVCKWLGNLSALHQKHASSRELRVCCFQDIAFSEGKELYSLLLQMLKTVMVCLKHGVLSGVSVAMKIDYLTILCLSA